MKILFTNKINDELINQDIIIYGAGKNGVNCLATLIRQYPNIHISAIIDNNKEKQKRGLCGIPIIGIENLNNNYPKDSKIIITPANSALHIVEILSQNGFHNLYFTDANSQLFDYISKHKVRISQNRTQLDELLERNSEKIEFVRSILSDEKSLEIFNAKINSIYFGEHFNLEKFKEDNQYFPTDIISLSDDEVFVDAGCYDMSTSFEFINRVKNYRQIIAFECDPLQYEVCLANRNFYNADEISKICLEMYGLYEKNGTMSFESRALGGSSLDNNGNVEINVISLDEYFKQNQSPPTFIKMDIEGAEYYALKGSKKLINEFHPKLAICVYHGNTDIFEIPYWIKKMFPKYRIYLRQHSNVAETVCYALV
ncbi:MAG: FkbM family methyltransferase [Oscillospiraceae bacterium]|jgi:FkbM family methyltransferase|nr:FkbM family methyltransferase [Oscillospiraceae bacterium]